ncbi:hypothetical protein LG943_18350 [Streptomonospora sp. S1-112]|uniref:5-bromo-4-chloroindolyl phosphate hydrolysis protein n=1 Tax=Streptomonospora mangrovi TaxID=2883123 RepID=A0A9X3SEV5_9ACTN|nr:hypothetical protein [Streptomonospora mangrovi]MDA0566263.1 hypothetical protein [Streptomonospora mangrovi]
MATSERRGALGAAVDYLGSTRNLWGAVGGLAGLALAFTGLVGAFWPLAVAALYTAGALAAPPARVHLVAESTRAELRRTLDALDRLAGRVRERRSRLPDGVPERFARMEDKLRDLLGREELVAADPEAGYELERIVRRDLPEALETYLNLPWWYDASRRAGGGTSAAAHLREQVELLERDVDRTAERMLEAHARRQDDHTTYLRERGRAGGAADPGNPLGGPAAEDGEPD